MLLGLVRQSYGVASQALLNLGLDPQVIRQEVENRVECGTPVISYDMLPQTARTQRVIEYSIDEARRLDHSYVGTEHILLGLLRAKRRRRRSVDQFGNQLGTSSFGSPEDSSGSGARFRYGHAAAADSQPRVFLAVSPSLQTHDRPGDGLDWRRGTHCRASRDLVEPLARWKVLVDRLTRVRTH